jgi:hypothetical protein
MSQSKKTADFGFDASMLEGDPRWEAAVRASPSSAPLRATLLRGILLYAVRHTIQEPEEPPPEFEIAYSRKRSWKASYSFDPCRNVDLIGSWRQK